jgi:hypothetical protein
MMPAATEPELDDLETGAEAPLVVERDVPKSVFALEVGAALLGFVSLGFGWFDEPGVSVLPSGTEDAVVGLGPLFENSTFGPFSHWAAPTLSPLLTALDAGALGGSAEALGGSAVLSDAAFVAGFSDGAAFAALLSSVDLVTSFGSRSIVTGSWLDFEWRGGFSDTMSTSFSM